MKIKDLRELTAEELDNKIAQTRKEVMELRFQHATLKLESPVRLRMTRRKLAQMLTVQTEMSRK